MSLDCPSVDGHLFYLEPTIRNAAVARNFTQNLPKVPMYLDSLIHRKIKVN